MPGRSTGPPFTQHKTLQIYKNCAALLPSCRMACLRLTLSAPFQVPPWGIPPGSNAKHPDGEAMQLTPGFQWRWLGEGPAVRCNVHICCKNAGHNGALNLDSKQLFALRRPSKPAVGAVCPLQYCLCQDRVSRDSGPSLTALPAVSIAKLMLRRLRSLAGHVNLRFPEAVLSRMVLACGSDAKLPTLLVWSF